MKKLIVLSLLICCFLFDGIAQDESTLINKVKAKIEQVNDYIAEGNLKTDVSFIKAPAGKIKVWFKKPDKFRLTREKGISILPKGGVSINLRSVFAENNVALGAGESVIGDVQTKIVKLLPTDENSDIVLSTIYIDTSELLVRKVITTTKENGTYEINLYYGKYSNYALPDKIVFSFNTKDYKLPKGITLEFDESEKPADLNKLKNKKGKVEITYTSYIINKGVDDGVFK